MLLFIPLWSQQKCQGKRFLPKSVSTALCLRAGHISLRPTFKRAKALTLPAIKGRPNSSYLGNWPSQWHLPNKLNKQVVVVLHTETMGEWVHAALHSFREVAAVASFFFFFDNSPTQLWSLQKKKRKRKWAWGHWLDQVSRERRTTTMSTSPGFGLFAAPGMWRIPVRHNASVNDDSVGGGGGNPTVTVMRFKYRFRAECTRAE